MKHSDGVEEEVVHIPKDDVADMLLLPYNKIPIIAFAAARPLASYGVRGKFGVLLNVFVCYCHRHSH